MFIWLMIMKRPDSSLPEVVRDTLIDPESMQSVHVCSKRGRELMHQYMRCYFDEYLDQTKTDWNYILPSELQLEGFEKYFLLDVRHPKDFATGHLPDSTNIFWLELMKSENMARLPKNKEIVIICYVGHTASQILVLLKLLGYQARVLKFGMGISPVEGVPIAGWTSLGYQVVKEKSRGDEN